MPIKFMQRVALLVAVAAMFSALTPHANATTRNALIIASEGDSYDGTTITDFTTPFTNGDGKVGFVANLADSRQMVWFDNSPVFYSDDALPLSLSGTESSMGISNAGDFVYSTSVNGNDAAYTGSGVLLKRTDPAPGLPGQFISFVASPRMLPDGTAYFFSGIADTPTGSTVRQVLYKSVGPNPASITPVIKGGDIVDGFSIDSLFGSLDYDISNNGAHQVQVLDATGQIDSRNRFLYIDGAMALREGDEFEPGGHWTSFTQVGINNQGNYAFQGSTDLSVAGSILGYNGAVAMRVGDTVDGYTIPSGSTVYATSINNLDQVAFMWRRLGPNEQRLFVGNGSSLLGSRLLLATSDSLDINGDAVPDFLVSSMTGPGPKLDLADDGYVYVGVTLTSMSGTNPRKSIIRLATPEPTSVALLALGVLGNARRRRYDARQRKARVGHHRYT